MVTRPRAVGCDSRATWLYRWAFARSRRQSRATALRYGLDWNRRRVLAPLACASLRVSSLRLSLLGTLDFSSPLGCSRAALARVDEVFPSQSSTTSWPRFCTLPRPPSSVRLQPLSNTQQKQKERYAGGLTPASLDRCGVPRAHRKRKSAEANVTLHLSARVVSVESKIYLEDRVHRCIASNSLVDLRYGTDHATLKSIVACPTCLDAVKQFSNLGARIHRNANTRIIA